MPQGAAGQKLKVFISYSREDATFAEELLAGLQVAGFAPYLDKHDIAPGEPWEERLGALIRAADTVVFVISPDAIASERCAWEVAEAERFGKRLLPVAWRPVAEADVPVRLKRLNYIFFDEGHSFARSLGDLANALNTDLEWIRQHTWLADAAARWKSMRGGEPHALLRGKGVGDAEAWLKRQPKGAVEPTQLQREFIWASRKAARTARGRARRRKFAMGTFAACIMAMTGLAYDGWFNETYLNARLALLPELWWPKVLTEEAEAALNLKQTFKECALCPEMVVVPPGKFMMGEGLGQHEVIIDKAFAVSKFEVTFAEWDACYALGGCTSQPGDQQWGRGNRPVINVSWEDANQYAKWLSRRTGKRYRLLSEAEWEYAARAGTATAYPWGDDIGGGHANCDGCGSEWDKKQTAPVGFFAPNAFGLHDMHGNVWEWVEDTWHDGYNGAPKQGSPWLEGGHASRRVVRGGSWNKGPNTVRSWSRGVNYTFDRFSTLGLRVGRTLLAQAGTITVAPDE